MPDLSVVIVATDNEQRTVLQVLVDGTSVARTVHTLCQCSGSGVGSGHAASANRQSRGAAGRYPRR